jgi:hypothetical protein
VCTVAAAAVAGLVERHCVCPEQLRSQLTTCSLCPRWTTSVTETLCAETAPAQLLATPAIGNADWKTGLCGLDG